MVSLAPASAPAKKSGSTTLLSNLFCYQFLVAELLMLTTYICFERENRFILRNGQPPTIILQPLQPRQHAVANPRDQPAGGMVADLGVVPPPPHVPPVSIHYREAQEFEWAPGVDRTLQTGGPGGQNSLLLPLLYKELHMFF